MFKRTMTTDILISKFLERKDNIAYCYYKQLAYDYPLFHTFIV